MVESRQRKKVSQFARHKAHRLRSDSTQAESLLWRHLRRLPVEGSHFRRQVPIGPYVADFACLAHRLIVEVDGSQHADRDKEHDIKRTRWLASEGYRVLRFWNNEISENMNGVLEAIYAALHDIAYGPDVHPTPAHFVRRPSPSRGG